MTKWEYGVATINTKEGIDTLLQLWTTNGSAILENALEEWGERGWELVTIIPAQPGIGSDGSPANPWIFRAIFKRPNTGEPEEEFKQ